MAAYTPQMLCLQSVVQCSPKIYIQSAAFLANVLLKFLLGFPFATAMELYQGLPKGGDFFPLESCMLWCCA